MAGLLMSVRAPVTAICRAIHKNAGGSDQNSRS
jgi:hypothetical protein